MRILWFAGVQLLAVMGKDFNYIVEGMGYLRLSTKELAGKTDISWKESRKNSWINKGPSEWFSLTRIHHWLFRGLSNLEYLNG